MKIIRVRFLPELLNIHSVVLLCCIFSNFSSHSQRLLRKTYIADGHGKFEAIGSLFLSLTLLGTGIGVGTMSNKKLLEILALQRQGLLQAASASTSIPGFAALVTAALSIVSKEWLYRVTRVVGERIRSPVVIANAWHHRSDAYSSVLALGSIGLARYVPGLLFADAAAGLFVAAMICATGEFVNVDIFYEQGLDRSDQRVCIYPWCFESNF